MIVRDWISVCFYDIFRLSHFTAQMPKELRIPCIQAAIMLMPDENREVLQSLLLFLTDIAANSQENQVTERYSYHDYAYLLPRRFSTS